MEDSDYDGNHDVLRDGINVDNVADEEDTGMRNNQEINENNGGFIDLTLDEPDVDDNKQIEDRNEDEEFNTITVESYGVSGRIRKKYKDREDAKWSRPNLRYKNKRLVQKSGASSWICTMDEGNCKLKFTRSPLLWEHMENQHMMGKGAFHCHWDGCDKKYTHKAGLFHHIRSIHVGPLDDQYKYECKVCGRKHQNQMAKYRCCRNRNGRQ